MSAVPVIAIFDIGKTNKKFFLLNQEYTIVSEQMIQLEEITDEDGDTCEDVNLLSKWIMDTYTAILNSDHFDVKAINVSAYGASLVYINENGEVLTPLYSYLKKYPEEIRNEFYKTYGNKETISRTTASPVLGSLNSGMQFYRIKKEKPALYNQITYALHLPQFISFLITKIPSSDITSIGCHTQLWNFEEKNYHQWVIAEGINKKLAPILPSDKTVEFAFAEKKLKAGVGLHDSSAALIPYLAVFKESFVLISTGTWCISLNPFTNIALTKEELGKDCLCYLDYQGHAVKASRLFAGYQHEQQVKRLAQHFNKPIDFYKPIKYDPAITNSLQQSPDFASHNLLSFKNYEEAYHSLILDIIRQQKNSTALVMKNTNVTRIFVDGGFSNNSIYMHLLAVVFPEYEVYAASVSQATAVGAALAIHSDWNDHQLPADMIKLTYYKSVS